MTPGAARGPGGAPAAGLVARGILVPGLAGAACVFGFAPFYAWPVPILGLALLFRTWASSGSALQAAISGFAFGLGYFIAGVSWVYVSLHRYGAMPAALAALATFLFCSYLALFPALAGWASVKVGGDSALRRLWAMPAAFTALEWVRGWLFTGFPWLTAGTSQVPSSPLAGYAPLLGVYGTTLAVAGAAALGIAAFASSTGPRGRYRRLAALTAIFLVGAVARLVPWSEPDGRPVAVALLQGNVAQDMKWREEVRTRTLVDYRRMVFEAPARIVILPETAFPAFLDQVPADYLESLRAHARASGKEILLGAVERRAEGGELGYYNSVVSLTDPTGEPYRKRHLVPFGEFIPPGFRWVVDVLRIPLTDFARGGEDPKPLPAGGIRFGVAICYEDIFGEELIDQLPAAQALLNVSNDAWFGETFAAEQHLQMSQMRALETGRWMVRSTNTGITAAIDERGRIVARLPWFEAGTLVQEVEPRKGATAYVRAGNAPALLLVSVLLVAAWRRARRA